MLSYFGFRVCRGDMQPTITWVSIDDPGVPNHEGFTGEMSKYETTNAQYCQFLNTALASGDITVDGSVVKGNSGPYSGQNYYRLDGSGFTYNGATDGGASRINWTGSTFTVDSGFENHPVTYVSWYGATAFASITAGGCRRNGSGRPWLTTTEVIPMVAGRRKTTALQTIIILSIHTAQRRSASMGYLATGWRIWRVMSGSGRVVVITQIATGIIAFSAAAAGTTSATTARSRSGRRLPGQPGSNGGFRVSLSVLFPDF